MPLVVRLGSWSNLRKSIKTKNPCITADSSLPSALGGESAVEEEYVYEPAGPPKRRPSKVPPPSYRRPEL